MKALKRLSRNERRLLAKELNKLMVKHKKTMKALVKQGKLSKIIYQKQISKEITNQMSNAISAGLSMIGSGLYGNINKFSLYVVRE